MNMTVALAVAIFLTGLVGGVFVGLLIAGWMIAL